MKRGLSPNEEEHLRQLEDSLPRDLRKLYDYADNRLMLNPVLQRVFANYLEQSNQMVISRIREALDIETAGQREKAISLLEQLKSSLETMLGDRK